MILRRYLAPPLSPLDDLRFSLFDVDQCTEVWTISSGNFSSANSFSLSSRVALFTPPAHSRGNWKKSKRLNLISATERRNKQEVYVQFYIVQCNEESTLYFECFQVQLYIVLCVFTIVHCKYIVYCTHMIIRPSLVGQSLA